MQRRSDSGYRQSESTPSTRSEGAASPSSQAPVYPRFRSASSAMLATPARQQSFPDPAAPQLAHSAARPTLPPLSQFPPRPSPQYGSAHDGPPPPQHHGAHYAPPHDYHAPPGSQSLAPAHGPQWRPSPLSLHYGEPGATPFSDPRSSPASRGSIHNPLKRPYDSVHDRPYGEVPYSAYPQRADTGEGERSALVDVNFEFVDVDNSRLSDHGKRTSFHGSLCACAKSNRCSMCPLPTTAATGSQSRTGRQDRRPIDPPPVLQLMMTDFNPESQADMDELQSQFVVHCRLVSASSPPRDVSTLTSLGENGAREIQRLLLGTSVSSPFHTKDDPHVENAPRHPSSADRASRAPSPSSRFFATGPPASETPPNPPHTPRTNLPGTFFIFADLSVRKAGEYRLEFSLMKMDPHFLSAGEKLPILHKITSHPFRVVNAKDFDQVQPSTPLVRGLIERGAGFPLKLKKGTREGGRRRSTRGDVDESGSEEDEGG